MLDYERGKAIWEEFYKQKTAPVEGAVQTKHFHPDNITPEAVAQAVEAFKHGIGSLRSIVNVVGIQCYLGGAVEVQLGSISDLERLPGEATARRRDCAKYPYALSKRVLGVDFFTLVPHRG